MIDGIELLYQQIAESIEEAIPDEWTTARMEAAFFSESSKYMGEYTRESDGVARDFPTSFEAARAFREIRKRFKEAGKPLWGRAIFEMDSQGKFKMHWDYDNCDEEGNAIFDEEEELKKAEERHRRLTS